MKKVDAKVKNPIKNLEIKNLIKLDIMIGDKDALLMYQNAVFYQPKDIYLEQLQIFDQRQIYAKLVLQAISKLIKWRSRQIFYTNLILRNKDY